MLANIAVLAPAQDICQPIRLDIQCAVQVVRFGWGFSELDVVAFLEALQISVSSLHVRDASEPQFLHQPVLQRPVCAFDTAFGLARIGAQNLDVQLTQSAPELGDPRAALGVFLGHAKHRVLVTVKCNRPPMGMQVALKHFEVAEGALGFDKPQFHQRAGGIVDEHEQGAGTAPILEPAVIGAVDLDQLAITFPAQTRWWNVRRCLRDSQMPSSIIHLRSVSRDTLNP